MSRTLWVRIRLARYPWSSPDTSGSDHRLLSRNPSGCIAFNSINAERFPEDFAFQLTEKEAANGGRRYLPHAFTEHGAIMAQLPLSL
jgi:hypothetical protein